MNYSISRKIAIRWFAPAVFAIALISFQTARAAESTGSPESVAPLDAPADSRDLIAEGRERNSTDFRHLKAPLSSARGEKRGDGRRFGWRHPIVRREVRRTDLILGVGF
jgi:hypothetical protein